MKKKPDPIDVTVGHRIRIHRTARQMSQEKLANALGVSFQQVQKYEKGVNRVGASRLTRIAETLDVPVATLFEDPPQHAMSSPGPNILRSLALPGAVALVEAYSRIANRELQRTLVVLAEQIAHESK